ncbi:MAG: DUF2169 domain-containing protein [Polyangiaceae bacterium]
MDLVTIQPFVAGALRWQDAPDAWTMTVVVKLTLHLKPGTMTVAREPEPIRERDLRRASDPEGRVNAACDLAPFKAGAEVVVVGHAPAGGHGSLGRLAVGAVDKVIEISGSSEMLLGAELGPMETRWPLRADKKAPVTMTFVPTPLIEAPFGLDVERDQFHTAPPDQQLGEIRPDEALVLENLHPKLRHLSTRLPGIRPRARVEIDGLTPWEMNLTADTLWIDTDRSIATLVFRGQLPLAGRHQPGRVRIGVERPGEAVRYPDGLDVTHDLSHEPSPPPPKVAVPPARPSAPGPAPARPTAPAPSRRITPFPPPIVAMADEDDIEQTQTNGDKLGMLGRTGAAAAYPAGPALPFGPGQGQRAPNSQSANSPSANSHSAPVPPPRSSAGMPDPMLGPPPDETSLFMAPQARNRVPTWLGGMDAPASSEPPTPHLQAAAAAPLSRMTPVPFSSPVAPPSPVSQPGAVSPLGSQGVAPPPLVSQMVRPADALQPPSLVGASNRAVHDGLTIPSPAPSRGGGTTVGQAAMAQPSIGQGTIGQSTFGQSSIGQGTIGQGTIGQSTFGQSSIGQGTIGQGTIGQSSMGQSSLGPSSIGQGTIGQGSLGQPTSGQGTIGQSPTPNADDAARRKPEPRPSSAGSFLSAADASNAAAAALAKGPAPARPVTKPGIPVSPAAAPPPPRALVDFLWFATELHYRLHETPAFKRILEPGSASDEEGAPAEEAATDAPPKKKKKALPPPPPPPPADTKPLEERDRDIRGRVTRVLVRAEAVPDVEAALFSAIDDDGVLTPPLVVVAGEIELPFDETETLRTLVGAAGPLAAMDKKLKETIDLASDALGTPLGSSPDVAASFSARIREAWQRANRALSTDYLDVHTRRVLLEQRRYQTREILGAQWIRALLHASGPAPASGPSASTNVPVYLPAELTRRLPLFVKFPARLLVEVLPAQDQSETHPVALRALALARVISANTTKP